MRILTNKLWHFAKLFFVTESSEFIDPLLLLQL